MPPFTWKFSGAGIKSWHLETASASFLPHTGKTNTSPTATDLCCPSGQTLMGCILRNFLIYLETDFLQGSHTEKHSFIPNSFLAKKTALIQPPGTRHHYYTFTVTPVPVHRFSTQDYLLQQKFKQPLHPFTQQFSVPELLTSLNTASFYDLFTGFCNFI